LRIVPVQYQNLPSCDIFLEILSCHFLLFRKHVYAGDISVLNKNIDCSLESTITLFSMESSRVGLFLLFLVSRTSNFWPRRIFLESQTCYYGSTRSSNGSKHACPCEKYHRRSYTAPDNSPSMRGRMIADCFVLLRRDNLIMGYYDNTDNEFNLIKYKKIKK
jgi:hypothetical protein